MKQILVIFAALALYGCGIGGMWMNGNPFYGKEPYVPPRDYWVKKEAVSPSQRSSDWIECGGDPQGGGTAWKNLPDMQEERALYRRDYFNEIQRLYLQG